MGTAYRIDFSAWWYACRILVASELRFAYPRSCRSASAASRVADGKWGRTRICLRARVAQLAISLFDDADARFYAAARRTMHIPV